MPFDSHHNRRGSRRVSMRCKARIKSLHTGETHYGECADISVDGIALHTSYVPQYGEHLMVLVLTPAVGSVPGRPFEAEVEVRRCNELERHRLYEIGAKILTRR
ncbi:PilZ domain-containing protein [Paludibacterium sp.]|uniref:PilZ domain-containing protein n=1 Tax=Paludibacterium sp. TaxID=1917523 RepID=UPI0025E0CA6E|nr:PilZ domain-containing protein [Paludibacterium sp.]